MQVESAESANPSNPELSPQNPSIDNFPIDSESLN